MTALNKQALREMAERAASDSWGYDRDEFNDAITPEVVLALLDELEAAEERYEDMLRQARSFREAHDSAAEIIRKLERNKPVVKLPTTKLWAGKVACYEESEIIALPTAAGIGVKGSEMIHYHGGPITPDTCAMKAWKGRHAFISFAHSGQINLAAEYCQSFALDNGAFTAWKAAGKTKSTGAITTSLWPAGKIITALISPSSRMLSTAARKKTKRFLMSGRMGSFSAFLSGT